MIFFFSELGKAISERAALADKLSELSSDAAEVPRLRAELDKLSGIAARQAALDETLRQLQAENAQLAAELNEKHELEQRVAQLEQRNEMLENQNAETLSLLDDVRATAASLGDTFLAQAGKGGSLADELTGVSATSLTAPPATAAAAAASSAVSDEEAARLREERRRQQELMQLLSQQLKMAEDSMKGKEKEADLLRRELIKREQARKSGYLYKRGYYFGSWKKYFILLESEFLHYGDTPNKAFEGVVILRGARVEHSPATLSKRAFCFAIETMNRTYYLAADTEEEMVDWIVAIMAVIKEVNHPTETAKQIQNEAGTAFIDPRHKQKIDEKKLMAGVFENERRATPVSSFVHTSIKWQMRPPFSDREGNDVTGAGNLLMDSRRPAIEHGWVVLCNCPEAGARTGFVQFDTLEPTDSDGWEYAFAFQSDDWSGECGATSFVRRRRWVTEDGLELLKIRGDPLAARRTPKHITSPPPAVIVGHRPVIAAATTAAAAPQRKRSNASAVNGNTNE